MGMKLPVKLEFSPLKRDSRPLRVEFLIPQTSRVSFILVPERFILRKRDPGKPQLIPFEKSLRILKKKSEKANFVRLFRHSWKVLIYWMRSENNSTATKNFVPSPSHLDYCVLKKIFQTWRYSCCLGSTFQDFSRISNRPILRINVFHLEIAHMRNRIKRKLCAKSNVDERESRQNIKLADWSTTA